MTEAAPRRVPGGRGDPLPGGRAEPAAARWGGPGDRGATPAPRWRAEAPAKINLVLEVVGRRPDGFHELASVFAPLALADELTVRPMPPGADAGNAESPALPGAGHARPSDAPAAPGVDVLAIEGAPGLSTGDNLVLRAAALLRRAAVASEIPRTAVTGPGRPRAAPACGPLAFRLRKRIPVAAGLGGGSSDALAALDLAAAAWGLRLGARLRRELAAALGSDVPFFALGSWAHVRGRGEVLRRLPAPAGGPLGVLLVVPAARLSTRDVFAALDAAGEGRDSAAEGRRTSGERDAVARTAGTPVSPGARGGAAARLATAIRGGADVREIAAIEPANDLLPAAVALLPELEPLRQALAGLLGRQVHLSGSGPTLAVLYPSPGGARRAATVVRAAAARGALPQPGGPLDVIATRTLGGVP